MSLLTKPKHLVQVQLREPVVDTRGKSSLQDVGELIPVKCNVHPLSSADYAALGGVLSDTMRSIGALVWPGDINSSVVWDGYDWDTYGDPQLFGMSKSTRHYEIRILKRGAHV